MFGEKSLLRLLHIQVFLPTGIYLQNFPAVYNFDCAYMLKKLQLL